MAAAVNGGSAEAKHDTDPNAIPDLSQETEQDVTNDNTTAWADPTEDPLLHLDPLDFPWESLWHDFEGPWPPTA